MAFKIAAVILLIVFGIFEFSSGSAIPMWEFLSRGEKMSHLYSTFAKQVSDYCKMNTNPRTQSVAQCKRELLTYGLEQLQTMSDAHLDTMDPYQREANSLIWQAMMRGHPTAKTHQASEPTAAVIIASTGATYQKNPIFDDADRKHYSTSTSNYAMDMEAIYSLSQQYPTAAEMIYNEPQNHLPQEAASNVNVHIFNASPERNYLTGPMVIRVRPDGTPVEEDKWKPLPRDDDREAMLIGKDKLPTVEQIAETFTAGHQFRGQTNNYRLASRH